MGTSFTSVMPRTFITLVLLVDQRTFCLPILIIEERRALWKQNVATVRVCWVVTIWPERIFRHHMGAILRRQADRQRRQGYHDGDCAL
jgi:hypothetical protein